MAEGKESVVVYVSWKKKFDALSDEEAGRLIKHFFKYVSDENPIAPDRITELSFIDIQDTLKRDLVKWEQRAERSRENGKFGGRPPLKENPQKPTETQQVILEPKKPDSVNVFGIVNGIGNVNENHNTVGWGENLRYFELEWKRLRPNDQIWEFTTFKETDAFKSKHSLSTKDMITKVIERSIQGELPLKWSASMVVKFADEIFNNTYTKQGDTF